MTTSAKSVSSTSNQTPASANVVQVLFATDARFAPYAGVAICSVVEHGNPLQEYNIIVFETGLTPSVKKDLIACTGNRQNVTITFIDVEPLLDRKLSEFYIEGNPNLSSATYYRLYASTILEGYDRIVYLDSDLVVLTDIAELYRAIDDEDWVAGCTDLSTIAHRALNPSFNDYHQNELKYGGDDNYFNAGVLVMNLAKMRADNFQDRINSLLRDIQKPVTFDQDILNLACKSRHSVVDAGWNHHEWYNHTGNLDFKRNLPAKYYDIFKKACQAPKIQHYCGFEKPWHYPDKPLASYFWEHARKTPFYERLLADMIQHQISTYKGSRSLVPQADALLWIQKEKIVAKHRMYKVLSSVTAGNLRRHFLKLRDKYAAQRKRI